MNVCPNCFADEELQAFLNTSATVGDCAVCCAKNVPLTDLVELKDFFQELVDCFVPADEGNQFNLDLHNRWHLFSSEATSLAILNYLLPQLSTLITSGDSLIDVNSEIAKNIAYWEKLKDDVKWSRRFSTGFEYLTDELGWDEFFGTQKSLTESDTLFRARLHAESSKTPYAAESMMCPPREQAREGRANSQGIPVLYLSDNIDTTLYEVRATYLDEVSVGTFKVKEDRESLLLVDFTEDPTLYGRGKINVAIKAHLLKQRISTDLSKPMRRYDTEIEYVPTQFICEFIRWVTGANGIRFASSRHTEGRNVVIFDQDLVTCTAVDVYRVSKLTLEYEIVRGTHV